MELLPHQQRVVAEKTELDEKLDKLIAFFQSPTFRGLSVDEQSRLHSQAAYMKGYSTVLGERIGAF